MTMKTAKYKLGQWVRFYQSGKLVIGEVRYITTDILGVKYSTDIGAISEEYVIEAR